MTSETGSLVTERVQKAANMRRKPDHDRNEKKKYDRIDGNGFLVVILLGAP